MIQKIDSELSIIISRITPAGLGAVVVQQGENTLMQDRFNVLSEVARRDFIAELAKRLPGIDVEQRQKLETDLTDQAAQIALSGNGKVDTEDDPAAPPDPAELLAAMPANMRKEAEAMLADPKLVTRIVDDIAAMGVAGECELVATIYLVGTSRLLSRPLATIVQGPSSSGKSFIIDKVASVFPPESVIHATTMTAQSLYHLPPGALVHRFIVAGERSRLENDDTAEKTRALREMISSGKLSKLIPEKSESHRIVTRTIEQEGPIAYIESTTLDKIFEEDANRCLMLQTDERPDQTRRILKASASAYTGADAIDAAAKTAIIDRHHALQRMLKPQAVVIPFAAHLADLLPADRVEARRAIGHIMSMIEAVALLHQYQRKIDADGKLIAATDDYAIARWLLRGPMGRTMGGCMSDAAMRFCASMINMLPADDFDTKQVCKGATVSDRTVRGYLTELFDAGVIELLEPHRGPKPAQWRRTGAELDMAENSGLPTLEQLFPGPALPAFRQGENPVFSRSKAGK